MLHSIISQMICAEFRKVFQGEKGCTEPNKGMKITFSLDLNFDREDGYRNLQLLIFGGGSNYISVFAKLDWTVIPVEALDDEDGLKPGFDYTRGETPWIHFSCHDSCWTTDGVGRVLAWAKDRITSLGTRYDRWYETVELSDKELEEFRKITSETRHGRADHSNDFGAQEFRFPDPATI